MPVTTVNFFLGAIALLLAVLVVVVAVGSVLAPRAVAPLVDSLRPVSYELATAVAVGAMLGSLYYSEIAHFRPCTLCWVQRYFMYPSAIVLVIGLFLASKKWPARIALVLSVLGLPVSVFHRYEQAAGPVGDLCALDNPCSGKYVEQFGFITIPTMAGIGFAAIITFVLLSRYAGILGGSPESEASDGPEPTDDPNAPHPADPVSRSTS